MARKFNRRSYLPGGGELTDYEQRLASLYSEKGSRFDEVRTRLGAWTFGAPSGVETFYQAPTDAERADAVATMIFNAWLPRFVQLVWGDEPGDDLFPFRPDYTRWATILAFLDGRGAGNPDQLASWDLATEESVFFDRIGTPEKERADELMLSALSEALAALEAAPAEPGYGGFGTADMSKWLWGLRHLVRFDSLIAAVGSDPALAVFTSLFSITTDTLPLADAFPAGDPRKDLEHFPRGGDNFSVDAAEHGDDAEDFTYDTGPVMRMVIALGDETTGKNIVPGGQSGLLGDAHFADQAAMWLGNETIPMRFEFKDVLEGATARETFLPGAPK